MRAPVLALALMVVLAGCTFSEPAHPAEEPENATLPVPRLTPRLASDAAPSLRIVPLIAEAAVGGWIQWEAVFSGRGSQPVGLAYGGDCPRELVTLTIGEEGWRAPQERGAAWAGEPGCTPEHWSPAEPPALPYGWELRRRHMWNGTVAEPCAEDPAPSCARYRAAPAATYALRATAYTRSGERIVAEANVTLHDFCVDLYPASQEPGPHAVEMYVDNETVTGRPWDAREEGELGPPARWCGASGSRWLRVVDEARGVDEAALVRFDSTQLVVRHSPLRVEPMREWV